MELTTLLYKKESGIATITFNRPKSLNALSLKTWNELAYLAEEIENDDSVKCVIVTGGNKFFAAGGDIGEMNALKPVEGELFINKVHYAVDKLANLNKPVIAAIAGIALGGGCEVALACDIRIIAEGAKIGLPEINLGIFPGGGGTQRLMQTVGIGWAKDMILTGEPIDSEAAFRIGLVTRVVPPDQLMGEAVKLAKKLAEKAPITIRATKQCLNISMNTDLVSGLQFEKKAFCQVMFTEDAKEGTGAFMEKRKPDFKGR